MPTFQTISLEGIQHPQAISLEGIQHLQAISLEDFQYPVATLLESIHTLWPHAEGCWQLSGKNKGSIMYMRRVASTCWEIHQRVVSTLWNPITKLARGCQKTSEKLQKVASKLCHGETSGWQQLDCDLHDVGEVARVQLHGGRPTAQDNRIQHYQRMLRYSKKEIRHAVVVKRHTESRFWGESDQWAERIRRTCHPRLVITINIWCLSMKTTCCLFRRRFTYSLNPHSFS